MSNLVELSDSEEARMAVLAIIQAESEMAAMDGLEIQDTKRMYDNARYRRHYAVDWLTLAGPPSHA